MEEAEFGEVLVTLFRNEQNPEEVTKTSVFAKEVEEMLRVVPNYKISFNKLIPSYHQHLVGSAGWVVMASASCWSFLRQ